jgi:hypothetical protein
VQSETPTHGLAAYTNTQDYLLGPQGMQCAGLIAADGGASVKVWPAGGAEPAMHSASEGLTLFLEPACASCKAENACPFFRPFAQELGFPCKSVAPEGEQTSEPHTKLVLFTDPPGVAGSGWPSGGEYPANGFVGITASGEVFRSTCTLPASEHSLCTASLAPLPSGCEREQGSGAKSDARGGLHKEAVSGHALGHGYLPVADSRTLSRLSSQ